MDPYRFMGYIKIVGRVTLIWPPEMKISRRQVVFDRCIWLVIISINTFSLVLRFIHVGYQTNDPLALSHTFSLACIGVDGFLEIILVRFQWPRFQILIHEVTEFMRCAKKDEKIVCQKYMKRYLRYHCIFGVILISAIMSYASIPLRLGTRFPLNAWYPFSSDPLPNRIFIYVLQYFMIMQPIILVSHNFMVMTLIWYSTARFELLGKEFRKMRTHVQFCLCVKKHKELLSFAKETERAVSLACLKALGVAIGIIVGAGVLVSQLHDLTTMTQHFLITLTATSRFFGMAWTVDDLAEMAASLSWAIYQPSAFGKPSNLGKSMPIVIQMTQRSMDFRLWGINLKLSLKLFAEYVLKVFSLYMTMRAVLDRYMRKHQINNE